MNPCSDYREYNFDGLVGPTHNYGGLSRGNLASMSHGEEVSDPRRAALEGLSKMRLVMSLGVGQAVLPPHERPSLSMLRRLGFSGTDEHVLAEAASESVHLLGAASSASAMWTANAATVAPSCDTADGRLHLTPANLQALVHRAFESGTTERVLRRIFSAPDRFTVHRPLPCVSAFSDEGAANHLRLAATSDSPAATSDSAVHVFGWGRRHWLPATEPERFPARQTFEASRAVARLSEIDPGRTLFAQQDPRGIDAGAFHSDVLAVGTGSFLMLHELAFVDTPELVADLRKLLGERFCSRVATCAEFPIADAVESYAFNSQLLTLDHGEIVLLAPTEARENAAAHAFLTRVVSEQNPVGRIAYSDLRQSMRNGGGPACLRLRIPMNEDERNAMSGRVVLDQKLAEDLEAWIRRHYRDRIVPDDLRDPMLVRETMTALDRLTELLGLGTIYDFQRA